MYYSYDNYVGLFEFETDDEEVTFHSSIVESECKKSYFVSFLEERNNQNETPIQIAVKKGHFRMALFILHLFKESYSDERHRLICLDVISQVLCNEIPFVEKLGSLIDMYVFGLKSKFLHDTYWLELILFSIKTNSQIPKLDKIVSFDLIGAAFFSGKLPLTPSSLCHGLQCWETAMTLRFSSVEGDSAIPKTPHILSDSARKAFGEVTEFTSLEELKRFEQLEPSEISLEKLQIQALLVIQRIVSKVSPRKPHLYYFHFNFLLDFAWDCFNRYQLSQAVLFSLMIIEQFDLGSNSTCYFFKYMDISDDRLFVLPSCFKEMQQKPANSSEREELTRANILAAIKYEAIMAKMLRSHCDFMAKERIYNLVSISFQLFQTQLTHQEKQQLDECISQIVLFRPISCFDLLNLATFQFTSSRPCDVIHLFLKAGIDPNGCDYPHWEIPLHLWANFWKEMTFEYYLNPSCAWNVYLEMYWTIFQAIVDAGGRPDKPSSEGETAISILAGIRSHVNSYFSAYYEKLADPYMDSLFNTARPLSLSELCAQVIRHRDIPFQELPNRLQLFILSRKSKGHSSDHTA